MLILQEKNSKRARDSLHPAGLVKAGREFCSKEQQTSARHSLQPMAPVDLILPQCGEFCVVVARSRRNDETVTRVAACGSE
ncbi:MAG: hypothetical protein AB7H71_10390 [Alphaproteobacteria bacterium]